MYLVDLDKFVGCTSFLWEAPALPHKITMTVHFDESDMVGTATRFTELPVVHHIP